MHINHALSNDIRLKVSSVVRLVCFIFMKYSNYITGRYGLLGYIVMYQIIMGAWEHPVVMEKHRMNHGYTYFLV